LSKVRVLFCGTPEFAVASLQTMLADKHFEIVGVLTQPDRPAGRNMQLTPSPVKKLALQAGLNVMTPEKVNTDEWLKKISELGAESAAVVAFGQILSQKFLDLFPRGCVNVHASLLPRWRGAAPIQRAIMAGDKQSGVSLQKIVRKLDAGDVLGERAIEIPDEMDALELHDKLKVLGGDLLHVEYMDFLRGNLSGKVQDESLVTYAAKIEKSESRIDWKRPARDIFNHVRGLKMGPIAYTERSGEMLKIHKTRAHESSASSSAAPGEILEVSSTSFTVACSQGSLEVLEIQPASKAKMKVADYLRGYPLKKGERLG
jgi:methionyl-tRNA formyltransferase